jgi:hypothetical protein
MVMKMTKIHFYYELINLIYEDMFFLNLIRANYFDSTGEFGPPWTSVPCKPVTLRAVGPLSVYCYLEYTINRSYSTLLITLTNSLNAKLLNVTNEILEFHGRFNL